MATPTMSNSSALEEVRVALINVRKAFSTQQMEIRLLEEKLAKLKPSTQTAASTALETRIRQLEKMLEKIEADMHQFGAHANQVTESLLDYRNRITALDKEIMQQDARLDQISELKTTLHSLSSALGNNSSNKIHKVVAGDSLEKIARQYDTSVEALKKMNGLTSNTILIGQEVKIPE